MSNQNISSENPFASQAGFDPTAAPQQNQAQQSGGQDPWSQAQPQQNQPQQSGGQDPWSQAQPQGQSPAQDQQADQGGAQNQQQGNPAPQSQDQQPQQNGFQGQQPQDQQNGFQNQPQQNGFQGQQPQDQQNGFQNQPQQNGFQNQGGFQGQQNGFQNQGGFQNQPQQNGFQNQGGFQGQQNGFQQGQPQQNGFQNQGGFQGQQNGFQQGQPQHSGETITASGPVSVDLNNPNQYMYQAGGDRGNIREEGDAVLLMVPTKIEYDVPSKYGNGNETYNRCILDYLVVTGPKAGTVYRDSMNFNSYIIYSMQDALKRNMPIVGMVKKKATKKAPNGAWMIETVEDENMWKQAAQMGIQHGLLRGA